MLLKEIHHEYDGIDYKTRFNPLKRGDTVRVFHGYHYLKDAVEAAHNGLSGALRAERRYSYENNNNPKGLFVTLDINVAKDFGGSGAVIEFVCDESALQSPVWPGNTYTVQGGEEKYFSHGPAGRAQRRAKDKEMQSVARGYAAKDPEYMGHVAASDDAHKAFMLTTGREYQALFVGHLNPNQIAAFWVSKTPEKMGKYSEWRRLSVDEFLAEFGDKAKKEDRKLFGPNDDFDPELFKERLGKTLSFAGRRDIDTGLRSIVRHYIKDNGGGRKIDSFIGVMNQYLWPKQYVPAMRWMMKYVKGKPVTESVSKETHEERMKRAREQGFDVDNPHYHGTPGGDFDEFDPYRTADENLAYGKGVYTTRDPDAASGYSRSGASWGNADHDDEVASTVYKVYVKVRNPFDLDKTYPYAEIKRIFEHCFDKDTMNHLELWQEILKDIGYETDTDDNDYREQSELEELEHLLYNIDYIDFDGKPDPDDYEDGEKDKEYIADLEHAKSVEVKYLERRIASIRKREAEKEEDRIKMIASGRLGSAFGRDIYRTLWTNTDDYHDWRREQQLIGGETDTFEHKTQANEWLEELGYDGIRHIDRYNPGNKGKPHEVTIAFKPQQVRSAHANFAPDKADSPKLSETKRTR